MSSMRCPRRTLALIGASLLALPACGGDGGAQRASAASAPAATATTIAAPATTTVPTTTTAASTTTVAPATTPAPTTAAPTTVVVAATEAPASTAPIESMLPTPAAPPAANAPEAINQIGTVEIPAIGVSKSLYEGVSLTVLDHGPGHWPGTAGPGQVGNMVLAGHRMSHDHPFRDIDKLVPGDQVIVTDTGGTIYTYQVTSTEIVTPDALWITEQSSTPTATLFACHPKGSTRQRIVVHLELASTV